MLTIGFCYSSNNKHVWAKRPLSIAPYPGMVITYIDTRPNHRYCMYRVSMAKLSRNNRLGLLVEGHLAPLGSQRRRQVHVICSKMALRQVILLSVSYLATLRDRLYHHYSKTHLCTTCHLGNRRRYVLGLDCVKWRAFPSRTEGSRACRVWVLVQRERVRSSCDVS